MANLYAAIVEIVKKEAARTSGGQALYQPGQVTAVNEDGTYRVDVGGKIMTANPETDLPLSPGAKVYVSTVRNGKPVVHGPR